MILKGHQIVPYRPADVFSFSFQSNLISWFGETFSSCPDSKQPLRHLWANFHCGNCTVLGSLGQNRPCALLLNLSPAGVEALSPGTAGKYRQVCVWLLGEGVKKKNGGRMGGVDMCRGWWWRGWGCLLGSAVLFFSFFLQTALTKTSLFSWPLTFRDALMITRCLSQGSRLNFSSKRSSSAWLWLFLFTSGFLPGSTRH